MTLLPEHHERQVAHHPQPDASRLHNTVAFSHGNGCAPFTAVLWDLDGTISDSAEAIMTAMRRTYTVLGMRVPDDETLLSYVGPPITESFRAEGLRDDLAIANAVATYRKIYRETGLLAAPQYPGIAAIIRDVRAAGIPQSTATSKPESSATRVLNHYGLADEFLFVTGASEDQSRSAKAEVVKLALQRLDKAGVDLSNVVMIGDRYYDVTGAATNGVPAVYVTWGYGQCGEEQGAIAVVTNAEQLREVLQLSA